jgi:hypothetical protein
MKPVKDFAKIVCNVVVYGLVMDVMRKNTDYTSKSSSLITGYDDAVEAITRSKMYSHDKTDAVTALKRNEASSFYRAVIHIANDDDMYSHDKVRMIKALNE